MITATRHHDFSYGHRIAGHENKCASLHGHNGRVEFTCDCAGGSLDSLGRVLDFSVINSRLCQWVEASWDHKFLLWTRDPLVEELCRAEAWGGPMLTDVIIPSIVQVPFNPTAENMAAYLLNTVGPRALEGTDARLVRVTLHETRKCSATVTL